MACPRLKITGRHGAERKDSALTYPNPRADRRPRTNPCPVLNHNGLGNKIESVLRPVMVTRAQIGALRNAALCPYCHLGEIVNPNILPNPAVHVDGQAPGKFNSHIGLYDNAGRYARAEGPQNYDAEQGPGDP